MSGHTQEPWTHHLEDNIIVAGDGRRLIEWQARSLEVGVAERDANARRIVACVNACEGIPTGMLEAGDAEILAYSMRLKQQRDNLLAALKDIASRHRHRGTLTLDVEEFIDIENLIAEIEASK